MEQPELLDLGEGTQEEVRQNLADMDRVNRWLGGHLALRRFLLPRIGRRTRNEPVRILDLGSGAAHTPVMLARWARRRGIKLRIVALDASHRHLGMAPKRIRDYPEVLRVSADACNLPFPGDSFDFVISTLFLHHLSPDVLGQMLQAIRSVCRGSIILNDLVRSAAASFLFRRGAPLVFANRLTLHDGLVSIGQAYTPAEMREILHAADLSEGRVHTHRLYRRMTVVID